MTALMTSALWDLGRGTGIVALIMFTLTMVLGITTRSGRSALGVSRFGIADLHRTASLAGAGLILVHVGTLLLDPYAQLRLFDLVFPFVGNYRPLWLGLGTLAVDVLLAIIASSLLRHRIGPRAFRGIHWAAYAMWPLALVHALGNGTDAGTVWFRAIAACCTAVVVGALGWRLSTGYAERGMTRTPRKESVR
jgi:methionine sulfoxide reductase heme-binding subunit